MSKFLVAAFYPNMDMKYRMTEYNSQSELYGYLGGLQMCNTPYVCFEGDDVKEYSCGDISKLEMLKLIDEYL